MSSPDWYAETLRLSGQVVRVNAEHRALREIHARLEQEAHELRREVEKLREANYKAALLHGETLEQRDAAGEAAETFRQSMYALEARLLELLEERDGLKMLYHSIPNANQRDRAETAEAERDQLRARVAALEEALRMVEWTTERGNELLEGVRTCPWCRSWKWQGHDPDCPRQAALEVSP